jgi:hypothetical protein
MGLLSDLIFPVAIGVFIGFGSIVVGMFLGYLLFQIIRRMA